MAGDEIRAKCAECGTELTAHDQSCPKCRSTRKLHDLSASDGIRFKASLEAEHRAPWDAKSYGILFGIWAVCTPIYFGVMAVVPLSVSTKIALMVGLPIVVAVCLVWQRYRLLMVIRWLDKKFTASKTFHSE